MATLENGCWENCAVKNTLYLTCGHTMALAILAALVLNWAFSPATALGIILGAAFSCLNLILIPIGWRFCAAAERKRASVVSLASIAVRYLMLSLPLVLAASNPAISFWATAAGIMAVQIYLVASHAAGRLIPAIGGQTRKGASVK